MNPSHHDPAQDRNGENLLPEEENGSMSEYLGH